MLRKLLTIALPLLLPFLLYWLYVTMARRRAAGGDAPTTRWQDAPWVWIAAAGVVLMATSLALFEGSRGVDPGTRLAPPVLRDGEIVPSHPVDD